MKEIRGLKNQRGYAVIGYLVSAVISYAIGYAINAIFNNNKIDPRIISPKFEDNQAQIRSAVEPHKIVYGTSLVSGPLIFAASNGTRNQNLHIVIPMTGHEVESMETIYFDDISSASDEFNKIEKWFVDGYAQAAEQRFTAAISIDGVIYAGATTQSWSGNHSRLNMTRDVMFGIKRSITESPGYSSRNYTATWDGNMRVTITAKESGVEIDVQRVAIPGAAGPIVGPGWWTRGGLGSPAYLSILNGLDNLIGINDLYAVLATQGHIFDIYKHLGSSSQVADSNLVAEDVGWTVDHRLQGRSYVYAKLKYYAERWPTGVPTIKAEIKGKLVYDPRSLLTAWSSNPALCIRDYLLSAIGLNARASEIDEASFIAAANICDEIVLSATPITISVSAISALSDGGSETWIDLSPSTGGSLGHNLRTADSVVIVGHTGSAPDINGINTVTVIDDNTVSIPTTITVGGTGGTMQLRQARYQCNGTITLGERPIDVVQKLLTCCDGTLVYTEGTYKLFVGAYTSPVGDLDESHLRGSIQVVAKPPRKNLFNGVRGTFVDKHKYWQETDFPLYKNSTYITQDGGEEILRDITLPFTTDVYCAQRLAKQLLERSRQGIIVKFPAKLSAFKYSVNDVIRLTIDHFGWAGKEFRVISWALVDFGIDYMLQEESSTSYSWNNGDETQLDSAPNTNLPDSFSVTEPTGVTAEEELYQGHNTAGFRSRIRVDWTASADLNVVGYIIYWRSFADEYEATNNWHDGQSQVVTGETFSLEDVPIGIFYISIRAVNSLGIYSAESDLIEVTVLGKTAPPDDVTGFSVGQNGDVVVFTWNAVTDIDLKGYEVRYGPRETMTWDSGVVVTQAERGTEVTTALIPPGDWTFCIKAQDTSDIYSTNATCRDLEITQSRTIIETLIEDPDFLGTKSNFVFHWTGALVPDSQDLASVDSWDTFDQFVPNAYTTCYYTPLTDIDIGFVDDIRAWADINASMGPGETTGSPQPFTEIDYHSGTEFDGYEAWTIGLINTQYVRMRLGLTPANGKCYISRYRINTDVAEQSENDSGVVIGASGTYITFTNQFHNAPSIQITVQGSALIATYTGATGLGFTVHVYNTDGTEVGGTINWTATGV